MSSRPRDNTIQLASFQPKAMPSATLRRFGVILGTGVAVLLAQYLAIELWVAPSELSTVWLPGALLLAVAILSEPGEWPRVISAGSLGMAIALVTRGSMLPHEALVLAGVTGVPTLAVTWTLRRTTGPQLNLGGLREFLVYLGIAVVGGALAASLLFLAAAWGVGVRPATFQVGRTFMLGAMLGYLTMTPTVVLLSQAENRVRLNTPGRRVEAVVLGSLLVLVCGFVFSDTQSRAFAWPAFAMTFPPLLIWAALRFHALGASAALLLVALISTLSTLRGLGPFTNSSAEANTLSLQLFILGTGLPLMLLATALGEQRRTLADLESTRNRLLGFNRDLVAAREKESTRIARELHDDVGQRLAVVSIGLSRLRRAVADGGAGCATDIIRIQEQTASVARSLRELSHQLHPGALEHVGLAAALRMKCDEVQEVTGLPVRITEEGELPPHSQDVALCLYRVAQEALSNAVRHSRARSIRLLLRAEPRGVLLQVSDDGRGFDPNAPRNGRGLGLLSLTERLAPHSGSLTVDSAPGKGTVLRAVIPLAGIPDA